MSIISKGSHWICGRLADQIHLEVAVKMVCNTLMQHKHFWTQHTNLKQANSNRESCAGASQWSFALCYWPRIMLKLSKQVSQYHVTLVHRLQKPALSSDTYMLQWYYQYHEPSRDVGLRGFTAHGKGPRVHLPAVSTHAWYGTVDWQPERWRDANTGTDKLDR